jgi:hypothetical protein
MKRIVLAALAVALVSGATMVTTAAQEERGDANRARGIEVAVQRSQKPESAGKVTFSDLIISGRPIDTGGNE